MGCFASKENPEPGQAQVEPPQAVSLGPEVSSVTFPVISNIRGIKFLPSAASWCASGKLQTVSRVIGIKGLVFTCLFEGIGDIAAAQHLDSEAFPCFSRALNGRCEGDITAALRATFQELEETLLQAARSEPAMASSGACGVIAVVDLGTNTLHAASVGGCVCLVARTVGSFKQTLNESSVVADGRKARSVLQGIRVAQRPDGPALEACRAHVLGFGVAKRQPAAEDQARVTGTEAPRVLGAPCPSLHCEVGSQPLRLGDGHVLLLSSGLLDLMAPASVAVLAQQFDSKEMQALIDTAAAAAAVNESSAPSRPVANATRVAVDGDLGTREQAQQPANKAETPDKASKVFNVSDLVANYALSRYEASRSGSSALTSPLCSDVALVSIAIDFPRSRDSSQLDMMTRKRASEAGRTPRAALRWHMVRRLMSYEIQRRKVVRKCWHDIRAGLVAQADQHARMAEQVAWQHMQEAVQVTRTGQVMRPGTTSASSRKYELSDSSGGDGTDHAALPDNNSVRRTHTQTQQPGRIALNAKTAASPGARLQVAGRSPAAASKRLSGGGSSIGIRQSPATTGSASKVPRALVLDDTEDLEDLEPSPAKRPKNKSPPTGGGRLGNSDTSAGKRCETDDAHGELALDQSSNNNAPAAALSEKDRMAAGL